MVTIPKKKIYNVLALLFLINGMYFFFAPDLVHEAPPYKFFKYLLYTIFLILTLSYRTAHKVLYCLVLIPVAFYFFTINSAANIINFINYTIPLLLLFSGRPLAFINWKWVLRWALYISFFFGFCEILFLDNHYYMYNRGLDAYRVVSIYINPNNFGIILSILSFTYVRYHSKGYEGLVIYALSLIFVKLSGSKTGLIIFALYSIYLLYFYFKHKIHVFVKFIARGGIFILVLAVPAVLLAGYYFYETINNKLDFRTFQWGTLFIRFNTYFEFFDSSGANIIFPYYSEATYVDNTYLHLMGSFGALALICWLVFNYYVYLIVQKRLDLTVLLFSFMLIGLTTNFLYVWPLSYMYWGFVGYTFYATRLKAIVGVESAV